MGMDGCRRGTRIRHDPPACRSPAPPSNHHPESPTPPLFPVQPSVALRNHLVPLPSSSFSFSGRKWCMSVSQVRMPELGGGPAAAARVRQIGDLGNRPPRQGRPLGGLACAILLLSSFPFFVVSKRASIAEPALCSPWRQERRILRKIPIFVLNAFTNIKYIRTYMKQCILIIFTHLITRKYTYVFPYAYTFDHEKNFRHFLAKF